MYLDTCMVQASMYHIYVSCSWRPEESHKLPETGVTDCCEPPLGC